MINPIQNNIEALKGRIAELNACETADEVAELLIKAGSKGDKKQADEEGYDYCNRCVIARDLQRFHSGVQVALTFVWTTPHIQNFELARSVTLFIDRWDEGEYPSLIGD